MKKRSKKLVLSRETLAALDPRNLKHAATGTGGPHETFNTCYSFTCQAPYGNCQYSDGQNTCFTCEYLCTSNYC
jgi:hypothetical protein